MMHTKLEMYDFLNYYHWVNTSTGWLLVPDGTDMVY
jgi:hypothetical protein